MSEVINIEFYASANFSNLVREVEAANASLGRLRNSIANTDDNNKAIAQQVGLMERALRQSGQFTVSRVNVAEAEKEWGKQLAESRLRLRDYRKELWAWHKDAERAGNMVSRLARQQVALQQSRVLKAGRNDDGSISASVVTPNSPLNDVGTKALIRAKEFQILRTSIRQASTELINWGKNTQWAGRQIMVGITIPIGIFGAAAGKAFYEMDKGLTRMVKVYGDLGTQLSDGQVAKLKEDVLGLSKALAQNYGAAMTDTIGLAGDFAAVGMQGKDLITSTTEATRLAILGEVDRQDAMKTTLALTSAFQVKQKDLADTINFLNAVENQTSLSLQDLTIAIPKAGPVIRNLGGDVQTLALFLTAMKEGGVNAGEGANAIKSSLSSLINPTKAASEYLGQFGIDIAKLRDDNAGNIQGMVEDLKAALDTLSPLERQTALVKLFGKYQVSRLTALFDNLGRSGSQTQKVLDLMGNSYEQLALRAGIAEQELSRVTESASGKWNRALESFKVSLASVGEQFLALGTMLLNIGTNILDWWNSWPDVLKKIASGALLLAAAFGGVIMTVGVFGNLIGTGIKMAVGLSALFAKVRGGIPFWEMLNEQLLVNDQLGKEVSNRLFEESVAADKFKIAVDGLVVSLKALSAQQAQVERYGADAMSIRAAQAREAGMASVRTTGLGRAAERGHILSEADAYNYRIFGDNMRKGYNFKYGITTAPESRESNQGKLGYAKDTSASLFGAGGLKPFNAEFALRSGAGQTALQSIYEMRGKYKKEVAAIRSAYAKAEELFFKGQIAQAQEALTNIRKMTLAGRTMGEVYDEKFAVVSGQFEQLYKEVSAMDPTSPQLMARLEASARKLGVSFEGLVQAINAGIIDAQTTLLQMETSIRSQEFLGLKPDINRGNAGDNKAGSTGTAIYAISRGNDQKADDVISQAEREEQELARRRVAEQNSERAQLERKIEQIRRKGQLLGLSEKNIQAEIDNELARRKVVQGEREQIETRRSRLRGGAGKFGMFAALGAMTAMPYMTETGNAALDNGVNVAGGASMGAMMGSIAGPWGMAIGGAIGAIIPSIQILTNKMGEFQRTTEAAFNVGTDAAERYGLKLKDIADIKLIQGSSSGVQGGVVRDIADAIKAQEEGSPDRNLADFIRSEDNVNNIIGRLKQRATTMAIAGANPQQIQDQIDGLLAAGDKSEHILTVNAALELDFSKEKNKFIGGEKNLENLIQDQINDTMSKLGNNSQLRSKMQQAFGDKLPSVQQIISDNMNTFSGSDKELTDIFPHPTDDQISAWYELKDAMAANFVGMQNLGAVTDEEKQSYDELAKTLSTAAASVPLDKFWTLSENLKYSAMNGYQFAQSMRTVYGETSPVSQALQVMANTGFTTQEMLRGIALVNAGVISSWEQLQAMGPAYLDVVYRTNQIEQNIGKNVGSEFLKQLGQKRDSAISSASSGGGAGKSGTGASDALNKRKKAIQDYYDKEIEKIKDAEDAKKKAFEAEQRRLERQKRDMLTMISYREALAAGDFAAAAKAQIQLQTDQKKDALEDQKRDEENAAEKRIKALEKERDKKIDAIDKALDALKKANDSAVIGTNTASSKVSKYWEETMAEAKAAVDGLSTNFDTNMAKILQIAKKNGIDLKTTVQKSMTEVDKQLTGTFKGTGKEIWNIIKNDVANAPWSMIGEIVEAAVDKDKGKLNRKLALLKAYVGSKPKERSAAVSSAAKTSEPRYTAAGGGYITGPGSATSDSIPAWLSNGEYVIRAAAVKRYGLNFMDKLNNMRMPAFGYGGAVIADDAWKHGFSKMLFNMGGPVGGYATGGRATYASNASYGNINVYMNITEPGCSVDEIWNKFERELDRRGRKVGRPRR